MAQQTSSPSEDVKQALRANIAAYMDANDPLKDILLQTTDVIPIRSLRVEELGELTNENLEPTAWRFMGRHSSGALIAADVAIGPPPKIIRVTRDKVIGELASARRRWAADRLVLVRLPEVLTDVFWMKNAGFPIRIAPIRTKAKALATEKDFPVDEFVSAVETLAEEFKKPEKPGDDSIIASTRKGLRK